MIPPGLLRIPHTAYRHPSQTVVLAPSAAQLRIQTRTGPLRRRDRIAKPLDPRSGSTGDGALSLAQPNRASEAEVVLELGE